MQSRAKRCPGKENAQIAGFGEFFCRKVGPSPEKAPVKQCALVFDAPTGAVGCVAGVPAPRAKGPTSGARQGTYERRRRIRTSEGASAPRRAFAASWGGGVDPDAALPVVRRLRAV